jgi:hypothetical protein
MMECREESEEEDPLHWLFPDPSSLLSPPAVAEEVAAASTRMTTAIVSCGSESYPMTDVRSMRSSKDDHIMRGKKHHKKQQQRHHGLEDPSHDHHHHHLPHREEGNSHVQVTSFSIGSTDARVERALDAVPTATTAIAAAVSSIQMSEESAGNAASAYPASSVPDEVGEQVASTSLSPSPVSISSSSGRQLGVKSPCIIPEISDNDQEREHSGDGVQICERTEEKRKKRPGTIILLQPSRSMVSMSTATATSSSPPSCQPLLLLPAAAAAAFLSHAASSCSPPSFYYSARDSVSFSHSAPPTTASSTCSSPIRECYSAAAAVSYADAPNTDAC